MSTFEIIMPKLGESVEEATITKWFVKIGDTIEEDQVLMEIATDKVDSEIPSAVAGTVKEIKYEVDSVVPVGEVVALIDIGGEAGAEDDSKVEEEQVKAEESSEKAAPKDVESTPVSEKADIASKQLSDRFYSPLVKSIAKEENISFEELDKIKGSGNNGRLTKKDLLEYIEKGASKPAAKETFVAAPVSQSDIKAPEVKVGEGDEVVEMDRLRKIIADHMVMSKHVSPHVTSIVEADVTNLFIWRNKQKDAFQEKYGERLTFMPAFTLAVAKALLDYPGINVSVSGSSIIKRKNINIGIAVALPSGNLIVPVIKNADRKNLAGLAGDINRLALEARENRLSPDDIQGGTFTITNFGSFKNTIGTPIINQPQAAILATGTIEKKPAVVETPSGDMIAIRHKMFLSLSYDHRVVDGVLGGLFLRKIADYLEEWKIDDPI